MKILFFLFFLGSFILISPNVYSLDKVTRDVFYQGCFDEGKKDPAQMSEALMEFYCNCTADGVDKEFTEESWHVMFRKLQKKWLKGKNKGGTEEMMATLWEEPFFKNLITECFKKIEENYDGPFYR